MASVVEQSQARSTEQEFKRRLVELGLIKASERAKPDGMSRDEHPPIVVEGPPISEFILKERR